MRGPHARSSIQVAQCPLRKCFSYCLGPGEADVMDGASQTGKMIRFWIVDVAKAVDGGLGHV